ncbi:MAG: hypothetical protein LQ338_001195 [Usnochroma carphineum]|nr:MAG: hypothetical protein LQ338_001195 [Usnochroma carphineum]
MGELSYADKWNSNRKIIKMSSIPSAEEPTQPAETKLYPIAPCASRAPYIYTSLQKAPKVEPGQTAERQPRDDEANRTTGTPQNEDVDQPSRAQRAAELTKRIEALLNERDRLIPNKLFSAKEIAFKLERTYQEKIEIIKDGNAILEKMKGVNAEQEKALANKLRLGKGILERVDQFKAKDDGRKTSSYRLVWWTVIVQPVGMFYVIIFMAKALYYVIRSLGG